MQVMTNLYTIPKKLTRQGDLVIIPRSEYNELLRLKKIIPLITPSNAEKRAIAIGKKQITNGDYITPQQLKDELGL